MIQKKKDFRNRLLEYLAEEAGCQDLSDLPTGFGSRWHVLLPVPLRLNVTA